MRIEITNRLHITEIPDTLREEVLETLTLPNPRWMENERMGRWNRNVPRLLHFYEEGRGDALYAPRGFIRDLLALCRRDRVGFEILDRRPVLPPVDFDFAGELKSFQQEAVSVMTAKDFGTLSAPTGSGKTVMALFMIARRRQPALVVVHTKDLAFQWVQRAQDFLGIPAEEVGMIGAGKSKTGERLTIALVQSLYRCAREISPRIGHLIVDECHRIPSRTFTEVVSSFDSRYMLGLSATPFRRDGLSRLIFWFVGNAHHQVEKESLVRQGEVLRAEVIFRETGFKPYFDPVNQYPRMLGELVLDDGRNRLIASDVAAEAKSETGGICLVLSDRKIHCETLRALLRYRYGISSELLTGDTPVSLRKEIAERMGRGEVRVLIATGQLIGEGFDCRDLSTLFLTTPIRFSGRVLQYLGRVLRPAPGKTEARVYDYVDVHVDVLKAAARARQRIYGGRG